MNPFSHTLLFGMVLLLSLKDLTEACSCLPSHPQQHFCNADIVIRAKVIRKEFVPSNNPDGLMKYSIKGIKIYKGDHKIKDIESVYTSTESSLCGVELDYQNKVEYLLTGFLQGDKVTISLCGMHTPWKDLSEFQMKSLSGTYQMGCGCKITNCSVKSCDPRTRKECLWKDWVQEHTLGGSEALNNACIERHDGSCTWQPGLPNKQPNYGNHP